MARNILADCSLAKCAGGNAIRISPLWRLRCLAFAVGNPGYRKALVALAALAIATSGVIAGFHAGVEYGWWEGLDHMHQHRQSGSGDDLLKSIMNAPLIRCDVAPWTLFGISLAGL